MKILTTVLILVPIICGDNREQKLIGQLNELFNFDHNIFLLNSSVDIDRFVNGRSRGECTPKSVYVFKIIDDDITGLDALTEIKSSRSLLPRLPNSKPMSAY